VLKGIMDTYVSNETVALVREMHKQEKEGLEAVLYEMAQEILRRTLLQTIDRSTQLLVSAVMYR